VHFGPRCRAAPRLAASAASVRLRDACDDTGYKQSGKERIMNQLQSPDQEIREATANTTNVGRVLAVGTVVLWLVTLLLLTGPSAVRGLF